MRVTTGLRTSIFTATRRRALVLALAGTALGAMAAGPAGAASFLFTSGNYMPGITSPNPLLAPDTLSITTAANKFFNGVTFVNQSGTVDWSNGAIFLQNGGTVDNRSLWIASGNDTLTSNGGATLFDNSGTFRKSGGSGTTTIGPIVFTNSGTIDAQTGRIAFGGGQNSFNDGTAFTGAGIVSIGGNSSFNGAISSANLDFDGGVYTGGGAVLSGSADFHAGTFSGDWTLAAGSTFAISGASNKFWDNADFTNAGTVAWSAGTLFLQNGATITNSGLWEATGNDSLLPNGGAAAFINDGVFRKSSGSSNNSIGGLAFTNNGTIDTQTGILAFNGGNNSFNAGTAFTGGGVTSIAGDSSFTGGFTSANLDFASGIYMGNAAALTGAADFLAGRFTGTWDLTSGSTLTASGAANKFLDGATFTNDGTIAWQQGALFLEDGSRLTNNGLVDFTTSTSFNNNGGAISTIVNESAGLFRTAAGADVTIANTFVNNGGTITANGQFTFGNGTATFNTGTVFDGTGLNRITNDAAFNGAIDSTNLRFVGGTYTGGAATLDGAASWSGGTFTGNWTLAPDTDLTITGAGNKFLDAATFTNNGAILWEQGALFMQNGSVLNNAGTIDIRGNDSNNNNGGAPSSFVNTGLIQKSAGDGISTLANGIAFSNQGTIDVQSGTIALPTNFTNAGTLTGTGTFAVSGTLTNNGTVAPGNGIGTLTLNGNYLQTALGTLGIQLSSGGLSDLFAINGTAGLNGTLALSCFSCSLMTGDIFTLLDSSGDLSGMFANVTTSGFRGGFAYNLLYDTQNDRVQLLVTDAGMAAAVPEPATWATLLVGFGLIGGAMRRRAKVAATCA